VRGPSPRRYLRVVATLLSLLIGIGLGFGPRPSGSQNSSLALASTAVGQVLEASPELPLTTPDGEPHGGRFGASVALSSDGDIALVGAPTENDGVGAAWVFTRAGRQWNKVGTELAMPAEASQADECGNESQEGEEPGEVDESAPACRFGISVALAGDGEVAVVGAPHADQNGGAAWIFTRSDSGWASQAELVAPDPEGKYRFGRSVAISADGNTVLVGAPMFKGRAWVFTRSGSSWSAVAELTAPKTEEAGAFGHSVALSADGETALIGAPGNPGNRGAAWIFERSASDWSEPGAELEGEGESAEARFGFSVALSSDGTTALVGAHKNDGGKGAAWAFTRSGATWKQQGPSLMGGDESREEFGASVALSAHGNKALVGATYSEDAQGVAWLFGPSGAGWVAQEELRPSLVERSSHHIRFGSSVALASEAQIRLVGGLASEGRGQAWVFGPNPSVEALEPNEGPTTGGTSVTITGEHLAEATAVHFGPSEATIVARSSDKSITVLSPPGTGTVEVLVENTAGVSAESPGDLFTYTSKGERGKSKNGDGDPSNESVVEPHTNNSNGGSANSSSQQVVLPFGPLAGTACGAVLLNTRIFVRRHGRALMKLRGTGRGRCRGKAILRVRLRLAHSAHERAKHKTRYKLRGIGTAAFSIGADNTLPIAVKLNAAGRRLLRARHGRLTARLVIVKSWPSPTHKQRVSVRLVHRKRRKPDAGKSLSKS
jgi:hypothetical protein